MSTTTLFHVRGKLDIHSGGKIDFQYHSVLFVSLDPVIHNSSKNKLAENRKNYSTEKLVGKESSFFTLVER